MYFRMLMQGGLTNESPRTRVSRLIYTASNLRRGVMLSEYRAIKYARYKLHGWTIRDHCSKQTDVRAGQMIFS